MTTRARVLFVAPIREGGNGADWCESLRALGYDVRPFSTLPYRARGGRFLRSLGARLNRGPAVAALNADLRARAGEGGYDVALVVKGTWIAPATLEAVKARATARFAAHVTVDSQFTDNRSHHFERGLALYDVAFTDKHFEAEAYRAAGAREVLHFVQGYGRRFATRPDPSACAGAVDVAFVGHAQDHYRARLAAVAACGVNLGIWGPGWPSVAARAPGWAARAVRGDGLWGDAYPATMAAARIGLGLLSKRIPEVATTRSVEIPAAGAMLLAERTELHRSLFAEGVEAEYFEDDAEMADKIAFYLSHEAARARIAAAGHARARRAYAMEDRLREIMVEIARRADIAPPFLPRPELERGRSRI